MTPITRLRYAPLLLGLVLPFAASALVRADDAPPPHHRQPPQAAFDACAQKKAADTCSVTFGEHTMSGTCQATPDNKLVCRPDHPPGPPPELKAACTDKKAGDACSATLHDHTINGTCQESRHGDGLICHGPHPHPEGSN